MDCHDVREFFPWWLNGTLSPAEERQLSNHLESCSACREELEETRLALASFAHHLSIEALIAYAAGRDPGVDLELLETHLASCQACADELTLLKESRAALAEEDAPTQQGKLLAWYQPLIPTSVGGWRGLAVAASLLAVVAGFAALRARHTVSDLTARLADLETAQLNVAVVDLYPSDLVLRAGETAEPPTRLAASAVPTTLILNSQLPVSSGPLILEIRDADEQPILVLEGLQPGPDGLLTLSLPTAELPAGELVLHLSSRPSPSREPLESYRFQVH